MPPAPLPSWLIASSMYPIGDHSIVYVTNWLLFDNIGGIVTFVALGVCVYLSRAAIPCSYLIDLHLLKTKESFSMYKVRCQDSLRE